MGLKPMTCRTGICRSIQLSYRAVKNEEGNGLLSSLEYRLMFSDGLETEVCLDSSALLLCLSTCRCVAVSATHLALNLSVELNLWLCT